jgi:hypothetical protein
MWTYTYGRTHLLRYFVGGDNEAEAHHMEERFGFVTVKAKSQMICVLMSAKNRRRLLLLIS